MKTLRLNIQGMNCASCASSIERAAKKIQGVSSAKVNYALENGAFEVESTEVESQIFKAIENLGFSAKDPSQDDNGNVEDDDLSNLHKDRKIQESFRKFIFAISLAIAIFALAMWPLKGWPNQKMNWVFQLILCAPIWGWVGLKFQSSLLSFLKSGRSNMNTLIGLGTSAAFFYSAFVTLFPELSKSIGLTSIVYFEAVGFIISFVYLGQFFEEKAKRKTTEALNSLLKLGSKNALLVTDSGVREVHIEEVSVGSILRVKPGEKFPVDGIIVKGSSTIDEAMISGEPIPISKSEGDKIFAGTINGDSVIDYKAKKVGSDTFLAQIISFVEDAQSSKPEIQKYADKISSIFTPAVIVISAVTFLMWFFLGPEPIWGNAVSNLIAVLVIACPCALGLATPTAVVVATGRASLKGILIGGGEVIEKAVEVDTIIFDKTGTLTKGKPSVNDSILLNEDQDILRDVASIEQFSEHPLSKAIVSFALEKKLELSEPDSFEVIKGKGIIAEIDGREYIIGNDALFNDEKISIEENLSSSNVGSLVLMAKDKRHVGTLVIGDEIKETSKDTVRRFKEMGIETWMITGDNKEVAELVASELGLDHFIGAALPLEKSEQVQRLQERGRIVAMVGDGVNDAPALAKSNLSLAMGTGTDVAINASDVTIVKGDLARVLEFIMLSRGTMTIIKQNLFLSMIYNSLLIPVAAGFLVLFGGPMMPPVLASIAMALSSISVVSNSLRIKNLI